MFNIYSTQTQIHRQTCKNYGIKGWIWNLVPVSSIEAINTMKCLTGSFFLCFCFTDDRSMMLILLQVTSHNHCIENAEVAKKDEIFLWYEYICHNYISYFHLCEFIHTKLLIRNHGENCKFTHTKPLILIHGKSCIPFRDLNLKYPFWPKPFVTKRMCQYHLCCLYIINMQSCSNSCLLYRTVYPSIFVMTLEI